MIKISTFCFLLFLFLSCNDSPEKGEVGSGGESASEKISYLALGDSYTIGETVDQSQRWPVQLAEKLRGRGHKVEDPKIIAKTGWTTGNLLQAMEERLSEEDQYDLISVSIGVNNQYQGKSIEAYENDLHEIFERVLELSREGADGVFVVSIPDYGVTPFGASNAEEIGREIEQFNSVLRRVADQYEVDFYDITPISRRAKEEPDLIADDELHPSGKMYRLWVEAFVDDVALKLQ